MDTVKVVPVSSKRDFNKFIKMQWKFYEGNPYWVPPLLYDRKKILSKDKNPFFRHSDMEMFIAWNGSEPVGRIAAIKNDLHIKVSGQNEGFFGFFECINDQSVADKLFDAASKWLKEKGLSVMMGPANPSSNDDWGFLTDGFDDQPRFMMPYNPPYYIDLTLGAGLTKAKGLLAYKIATKDVIKNDKVMRAGEILKNRYKISIKSINLKDFDNELEKVKYVYNNAWAYNWGFVPFTEEEINSVAADLKQLIDPSLALFAEMDGKTVGFTLTLPDYNFPFKKMNGRLFPFGFLHMLTNKEKFRIVRILTLGIVPEYQKKGIDSLLYLELIKNADVLGVEFGEASWILEDNEMMNNALIKMGGEVYKKYCLYKTNI